MKTSATMDEALAYLREYGALVRHDGGFWACKRWDGEGKWFGTSTVYAIVDRGLARFSRYATSREGRFAVEARLP